jgi:hypothetical protein
MSTSSPSDTMRAFHALRRRWWAVPFAILLGLLLGLVTTPRSNAATWEAVVPTPTIDTTDLLDQVLGVRPNLDDLATRLHSDSTKAALGSVVEGAVLTATPATEKTSISLRVTAPTSEAAKAAVMAYASRLAGDYLKELKVAVDQSVAALDAGIASLNSSARVPGSVVLDNSPRLGEFTVRRVFILTAFDQIKIEPQVRLLSSASSPLGTSALLAVVFGALAAVLIALGGLRDRRLRYAADIEAITGPGSLLRRVDSGSGSWVDAAMLEHLSDAGPLGLVPLRPGGADVLTARLDAMTKSHQVVALPPTDTAGDVAVPSGRLVIVATLGVDTADRLEATYQALRASGRDVAGVVAVDGK